ncbi:MAG: multidrug effflux MFS transporter [Methylophilaceae bacterium]|nr:multidrug effflux MFS transporter [Methylophilaceae bacterium]
MIITLVLAALAALAPFAIDTYLPAFHVIAETLGATDVEVQQSLTFYLLPYAAMTLWHGAISDAIGRIATIKWGLAIFVVASIGCALATSVEMLWFFRALQGASGGAGNTVARAMVRDLFQGAQAQRVMASVQMLFGIAPAVAPIIGGILLGINWQIIFIFLAVYSAVSLWAAMRYLPETMPAEKRMKLSVKNVFSSYKTIFSDREYTKLIIAIGANFSGFFLYVLASPVFLGMHLALGPQEYGCLFIPTVTGMILGSWLARRAAGKVASYKVVKLSYAWMSLMALINLVVCFTQPVSLVANILPVALFNIGMAMCMPILSIAALDRHAKIRGTAASGQAFMQMLLSTVSAGIVVPYVWYAPSGLASAMFAYLGVSVVVIMQTQLWKSSQIRPLA